MPSGAKGSKFSIFITGKARTQNSDRAATLMATRKALTVADSLVPTTSRAVTTRAIIAAGRLMMPPSIGPSTRALGMSMWKAFSIRPTT